MKDCRGNKIEKGAHLYWKEHKEMPWVVIECSDGGLSVVEGTRRQVTPPSITVAITLPVTAAGVAPGQEVHLSEFIRIMNPDDVALTH